jgi:hypothetical protein
MDIPHRLYVRAFRHRLVEECAICRVFPCTPEREHFPKSKECGGKETWPICIACHDKLDRCTLDAWDIMEAWASLAHLFEMGTREERQMLVKMFKVVERANAIRSAYVAAGMPVLIASPATQTKD